MKYRTLVAWAYRPDLAGHGEQLAIEVLALVLGLALPFEVFPWTDQGFGIEALTPSTTAALNYAI